MIEDALKSSRTLERLLLVVALVALVFILSLQSASQEMELVEDLRRLQSLGSDDYGEFVREAIVDLPQVGSLEEQADALDQALDDLLEARNVRVLGSHRIADAFRQPVHIGRLQPEKLAFADGGATLENLDLIVNRLPVERPVQLVFAEPGSIASQVADFIEQNAPSALLGPEVTTIDDVQLYPLDHSLDLGDTFLADDVQQVVLKLEFQLVNSGLIPIFDVQIPGQIVTLEGTSFFDWLSNDPRRHLLGESDGKSGWLVGMSLTEAQRSQDLRTLTQDLERAIFEARADNQTIDLPGIEIPGPLAMLAIPWALVGLLTAFIGHLRHLSRHVSQHRETFYEFSWLALAPDHFRLQPYLSILVLPCLTQFLLAWRAPAFDVSWQLSVPWCVLWSLVLAILGLRALQELGGLRQRLSHS